MLNLAMEWFEAEACSLGVGAALVPLFDFPS